MAFTTPYTIKFSESKTKYIEFLHEVIKTPVENEVFLEDGFRKTHTQEFYELIFFNSGKRIIRVGKNEYEFNPGDVFNVCPDEEHAGKCIPCILDRYYVHISPDAFSDLKDKDKLMGIFTNRKKYKNNKITPNEESQKSIQKILKEINNTIRFGNETTKNAVAYALIIQLMGILMDCKTSGKEKKDNLFLKILSFMENSYPDSDVIENIVKIFFISKSSLWRLFKSSINESPYAHLQKIRLENACLLLKNGKDVTTVAMLCGFSDTSHFIKSFKEKYGVTPHKYKIYEKSK